MRRLLIAIDYEPENVDVVSSKLTEIASNVKCVSRMENSWIMPGKMEGKMCILEESPESTTIQSIISYGQ